MKVSNILFMFFLFGFYFSLNLLANEVNTTDPKAFNSDISEFKKNMKVYTDGKGHYIAIANSHEHSKFLRNRFFWGDGNSFHQLNKKGYGGNSDKYSMGFDDSRYGDSEINFDNGKMKVKCGDTEIVYKEVPIADVQKIVETNFNPLPVIKKTAYLFKVTGSDEYVYVDSNEYNSTYKNFRLFVGNLGEMKNYKINNVERRRDGGTTYIRDDKGNLLFSPTPLKKSEIPSTWNDKELTIVDQKKFDLSKLGIVGVPSKPSDLKTPCDPVVLENTVKKIIIPDQKNCD